MVLEDSKVLMWYLSVFTPILFSNPRCIVSILACVYRTRMTYFTTKFVISKFVLVPKFYYLEDRSNFFKEMSIQMLVFLYCYHLCTFGVLVNFQLVCMENKI